MRARVPCSQAAILSSVRLFVPGLLTLVLASAAYPQEIREVHIETSWFGILEGRDKRVTRKNEAPNHRAAIQALAEAIAFPAASLFPTNLDGVVWPTPSCHRGSLVSVRVRTAHAPSEGTTCR